MALIATKTQGGDFKLTPPGVFLARCFRIIDLGTQRGEWKGKEKWSRKVMFSWELHDDDDTGQPLKMDDGRPMMASSRYTLSLGDNAAMRSMLEGWRGKAFTDEELAGFDLKQVLDKWCMLNIAHQARDGKTFANVAGVSPVHKSMRGNLPQGVNPLQFFDVTEPNNAVFDSLSERVKETISACKEWQKIPASKAAADSAGSAGATGGGTSFDDMDDDIPF